MNSAEHEHAKQVKDSEHNEHEEHHDHHIQIVVEVNGRDVHVEFDNDTATGREIRQRAGAPLLDDLTRLERHKAVGGNIGLDDTVHLKNGDHFEASPGRERQLGASMNADTITNAVRELRERYPDDIDVAQDGARTLVIVKDIALFEGCKPASTDVLLVLDPLQAKPLHYVRPGQSLSNGQPVTNSSTTLVGGASWMTFSYNIPYQEGDSLARFITILRQRFAKP